MHCIRTLRASLEVYLYVFGWPVRKRTLIPGGILIVNLVASAGYEVYAS